MVKIELNNFKCKLVAERKLLLKLRNRFAIRNPNAFFIRRRGNVDSSWDGKIHYITDAFYFKTGLLTQVVEVLEKEFKEKVKIIDKRVDFNVKPKFVSKIGKLESRDTQEGAIKAIINNKVKGIDLPIGVLNCATNTGKTAIMVGLYLAYKKKIPTLVLLKDGELFEQFLREMPELIGDDFGYVRGKNIHWNKFTIAMVQTVSRNINIYKRDLAKYGMVLVDEADEGESAQYRTILQNCYNSVVRVGLSGSIFMKNLAKDKPKNQNLHQFFGEELYKVTKRENIDKGYSTELTINMCEGNIDRGLYIGNNYKEAYDKIIVYNDEFREKALRRIKINLLLNRKPMIVLCQFHHHVELMHKAITNRFKGTNLNIIACHHKTKGKTNILNNFREGKYDILVTTYIVKRGKNFPLLRYICNVAGGDSIATVSQIMGRLERKDDSKDMGYLDDFYHLGKYVERHSKHRLIQMKKEEMILKERFKI